MYRLSLLAMVVVLTVAIVGCGGSTDNAKTQVQKTDVTVKAPEVKTSDAVKAPEVKTATVVNANTEWLFVMKTEGRLEKEDVEKCAMAVKEKWLAGKAYQEVSVADLQNNPAAYEGKKLIWTELLYTYGEFEFAVRSGKLEKDGSETPIDDGPAPNGARGQDSMESLLKEIRFMK